MYRTAVRIRPVICIRNNRKCFCVGIRRFFCKDDIFHKDCAVVKVSIRCTAVCRSDFDTLTNVISKRNRNRFAGSVPFIRLRHVEMRCASLCRSRKCHLVITKVNQFLYNVCVQFEEPTAYLNRSTRRGIYANRTAVRCRPICTVYHQCNGFCGRVIFCLGKYNVFKEKRTVASIRFRSARRRSNLNTRTFINRKVKVNCNRRTCGIPFFRLRQVEIGCRSCRRCRKRHFRVTERKQFFYRVCVQLKEPTAYLNRGFPRCIYVYRTTVRIRPIIRIRNNRKCFCIGDGSRFRKRNVFKKNRTVAKVRVGGPASCRSKLDTLGRIIIKSKRHCITGFIPCIRLRQIEIRCNRTTVTFHGHGKRHFPVTKVNQTLYSFRRKFEIPTAYSNGFFRDFVYMYTAAVSQNPIIFIDNECQRGIVNNDFFLYVCKIG